jgi:hypothetical protein
MNEQPLKKTRTSFFLKHATTIEITTTIVTAATTATTITT